MFKSEKLATSWLSWLVYELKLETIKLYLIDNGFEFIAWIDTKDTDVQILICSDHDRIYVIVRGTTFTNWADWKTNFDIKMMKSLSFPGFVHRGFYKDARSVRDMVVSYIPRPYNKRIIFGGHSQGGAVAPELALLMPFFDHCYTEGEPRHMDEVAAEYVGNQYGYKFTRIVNNNDPVCKVPLKKMGFKHITNTTVEYYTSNGQQIINPTKWQVRYHNAIGRLKSPIELGDHTQKAYFDLVKRSEKE